MKLSHTFSIIIAKLAQKLSHLYGGGSALPGLILEKLDPKLLGEIMGSLPRGVVVISGTNGKTTTTKIVSELLEKQGLRVFTNKTGSNFVRGILSSMLEDLGPRMSFNYDIAVLELDEAHAVHFAAAIPIDYALILNIQRDQLDRFCELDQTAALLSKTTSAARKAAVLNREDPLVAALPCAHPVFYGLSDPLRALFPSDENLLSKDTGPASDLPADVILDNLHDRRAVYLISDQQYACDLNLDGIYNAFNAAGALALCMQILPDAEPESFLKDLANVRSAFGRSEIIPYEDTEAQLILVKNPSAFAQSIASFAGDDYSFMIVINDHDADGRDVSWLWNVDFSALSHVHTVSGTRAADMALRLKYDNVICDNVEEDLHKAIPQFMSAPGPKRIFATYTAMLEIRRLLTGRSLL